MPTTSKPQPPNTASFPAVFAALRGILAGHAGRFKVAKDTPRWYLLEAATPVATGAPTVFAGVRLGKRYVSIYLTPLDTHPDALPAVSDALAELRQGESCFNFAAADPALFAELATLVAAAVTAVTPGAVNAAA